MILKGAPADPPDKKYTKIKPSVQELFMDVYRKKIA